MNKKAIYIRVSDQEQIEGHSLFRQFQVCNEFAKKLNLENIVEYRDEGYSATNIKRPAIKKLINDIENNVIDTLIITELDRLSRNISDAERLLNLILEKNIKLYTVLDNIKIENADDRLTFRFKMAIAQHTSEKIGEKTINGLKGGLAKGIYSISRAPLGYLKNNSQLLPIQDELEIIKEIFNWYVYNDLSTKDIEEKLKGTEYKYTQKQISRILNNEKYTGEFEYRGDIYSGFGLVKIISKTTFLKAKDKLKASFSNRKYIYYFEKKLICDCCGKYLEPHSTKKKNKVYL